jgi:prevent-host-death family protein
MMQAGHIEVTIHIAYVSRKTIAAAKFKAHCLTLMDEVHKNREPIGITKRGKPVAKLVPAGNKDWEFLGRLEGIFAS